MSDHIGVDGCRLGWVAVFAEGTQLRYRLFHRFDELVAGFPRAITILVDIPIGLPWSGCPTRPCDTLARRRLGAGRASSVFPAPSRAACGAPDVAEARRLNIAELGRSLSAQAWGICAKVAEVDQFLRSDMAVRSRVREVHPEVCFWGLNGSKSMRHAKSTKEGQSERMTVLSRHEPRSQALLDTVLREQRRKDVQADDVLDALVGFITAAAAPEAIQRVQGDPAHDAVGLPMEMLYL
jgi:predicted RNase H-like nuclease